MNFLQKKLHCFFSESKTEIAGIPFIPSPTSITPADLTNICRVKFCKNLEPSVTEDGEIGSEAS